MNRQPIHSADAPAAIGPYSQAIRAGSTVYLSGQIPLDPKTGQLVDGIDAQAHQVFKNLRAVAAAAGGSHERLLNDRRYVPARAVIDDPGGSLDDMV